MDQALLEEITRLCPEKKIQNLCRKLLKKCSFNSGADAENLCHLAYRLYVYGYWQQALAVCACTHQASFPGRGVYNVWDFLLFVWGLEAFILQSQGREAEAKARVKAMDEIWLTPLPFLTKETPEQQNQREFRRRERFLYPDVLHRDWIQESDTRREANRARFLALFTMIGYGVTGLFPDLTAHWDQLKQDIAEYVDILSKEDR